MSQYRSEFIAAATDLIDTEVRIVVDTGVLSSFIDANVLAEEYYGIPGRIIEGPTHVSVEYQDLTIRVPNHLVEAERELPTLTSIIQSRLQEEKTP